MSLPMRLPKGVHLIGSPTSWKTNCSAPTLHRRKSMSGSPSITLGFPNGRWQPWARVRLPGVVSWLRPMAMP